MRLLKLIHAIRCESDLVPLVFRHRSVREELELLLSLLRLIVKLDAHAIFLLFKIFFSVPMLRPH